MTARDSRIVTRNEMVRKLMLGIACAVCATLGAGETLYNGIELPDQWPPNQPTFPSNDPVPPYLKTPPAVIAIDVGRQLFVDDFLIESTDMTRTHHRPIYHPANPILRPERDHEREGFGPFAAPFSGGVWFDPKDGQFKMWYMGGYTRHLCLATSDDGIRWERPELDVVQGTNIVLRAGAPESNSLLMDLHEKDPSKRFKYFYFQPGGTPSWAMTYRHSADGIHWSEPQWRSGQSGDRSTVFYNPFRKKYVFLIRGKSNRSGRAKRYWEADHVNEAASVRWPGEGANRSLAPLWVRAALGRDFTRPEISDMPQLYQLDAMAYESLVVGLFAIHRGRFSLRADGRPIEPGRPKCNELTVGYSRDGFHWYRPEYETFLGVSETRGSWRWGNVQPVGSLGLVVGDHIYFYVSARQGDPNLTRKTEWIHDANVSTGLAVMRRDGFASMDAGKETKTLTTRPVRFSGGRLFVNVNASDGELRAEVLDREGRVLPEFSRIQCVPARVNRTLHEIKWKGSRDLSGLAGRPLRFRFHLSRGSLYSFWVAADSTGASRGYVLGGGPGFTGHADTVGAAAYGDKQVPFAEAGSDQKLRDSDGDGYQIVTLAADSSRVDVGTKRIERKYSWWQEQTKIADGQHAEVKLPVGSHRITLMVENAEERWSLDHSHVQVLPRTDSVIPAKGLVMWLKADAITELENRQSVQRWRDSSPNRYSCVQLDSEKCPRWVKDAINGMPGLRFDGEDDSLVVDYCRGLLYSYYNSTLLAVVRTESGGTIISHGHTNLAVSNLNEGTLTYASSHQEFPSGRLQWPTVKTTEAGSVPLGDPVTLSMRRSHPRPGGTALFVNRRRDDDGKAMVYHPMSAENGFIGVAYPGTRTFWKGDIAEIILYGRDLTDAELESVQKYLRKKYRIRDGA